MKRLFPILVLVYSATAHGWQADSTIMPAVEVQEHSTANPSAAPVVPPGKAIQPAENKARTIINQAIEALGGQAYLAVRDREIQGRVYSFHLGRPNGSGGLFWSFSEFPDKERIELTQERDIAELFVGNKGYEITYKGVLTQEKKDVEDYLRRRHYSLDAVLPPTGSVTRCCCLPET